MKNYFKLTPLFILIVILFQNCEKEETIIESNYNFEEKSLKTVSLVEAKNFFNKQQLNNKKLNAKSENNLQLSPLWKTLEHKDLFDIDEAKLTTSDVLINKKGNYESELFFINVNGEIHQAIYTIYKIKINEEGITTDALVFLNEIDGTFIDGYRIENGLFTKKITIGNQKEVQKAGFLMFLLQNGRDAPLPNDCWNTGSLPSGGAVLGEVVVKAYRTPEVIFINNWNVRFSNGSNLNRTPRSSGGSGYSNVMGSIYATKAENKGLETIDPNERCGSGYFLDSNNSCVETIVFEEPKDPIKNINDYLKCFDKTKGATITIYIDQPITKSDKPFSTKKGVDSGKAGHAFIGITQGNITRNWGLYPDGNATPLNPNHPPLFQNNQNNEYDVSLSFNVTANQLKSIINKTTGYNENYDLNDNNCSDYVLDVSEMSNLKLPDPYSNWYLGGGSNPGAFGEAIRKMSLPKNTSRNNNKGKSKFNNGKC